MKITIIGYSGSGKSTLAQTIGQRKHIPVLHLDQVHWLPGWVERKEIEEERIVTEFLDLNSSWVIDGNYSGICYERRLSEADHIIFMNFNRFQCLFRAWKRFRKNAGKTRDSMAPGCPERFDAEFVKWILHDGRSKKHKANYNRIAKEYSDKVILIKNQRQLTAYIQFFGSL